MDSEFLRATSITLAINLVYAVVALFVGVAAFRLVDLILLRKMKLEEEIEKGNKAAGIFGAAIMIFIAVVIGMALGK